VGGIGGGDQQLGTLLYQHPTIHRHKSQLIVSVHIAENPGDECGSKVDVAREEPMRAPRGIHYDPLDQGVNHYLCRHHDSQV